MWNVRQELRCVCWCDLDIRMIQAIKVRSPPDGSEDSKRKDKDCKGFVGEGRGEKGEIERFNKEEDRK